MNLQAALEDLRIARYIVNVVETELSSEKNDPGIKKLVEDSKVTEAAIMTKLVSGLIDELEENCGHADITVIELVHRWLGITDRRPEHDELSKSRWLDHLGTVASDIENAHNEYQKLAAAFDSVKSNSKVHALLTVKRVAAQSAEKRLLPAYLLALEAGGGSRASEIYTEALKIKTV